MIVRATVAQWQCSTQSASRALVGGGVAVAVAVLFLLYCHCLLPCCCTVLVAGGVAVLLFLYCCHTIAVVLQSYRNYTLLCNVQSAKPNTIALQPDELHVGDCQLTALLCRCLVLCWIDNTFEHSFLQQLLFSALESVNLV